MARIPEPRLLTIREARRAAVTAQLLSAPRPRSIMEVVWHLWMVQMDPTSAVARTEHLVMFSRLGRRYRPAELERLLWAERSLFEYRAFILPTSDLPVHRETMRGYPPETGAARHEYVRRYLRENTGFRRYVLGRLRHEGALRARDLEDRSAVGWRTGGWNDTGRNTSMMLEVLWSRGEVMIVGRRGGDRVWDLAERRLPLDQPRLTRAELAYRVVERQLRAAGIARGDVGSGVRDGTAGGIGRMLDGTLVPGADRALATLAREGIVVPVKIDGVRGSWIAHAEALEPPFRARTVLLSPFDRLIHDRRRTKELFGFLYGLEIYVPSDKRKYGYFVLPILHGDRLIGRIDPRFDREAKVLRVNAVYAETDAPASAGPAVRRAIDELRAWLGAAEIELMWRRVPSLWRGALTDRPAGR